MSVDEDPFDAFGLADRYDAAVFLFWVLVATGLSLEAYLSWDTIVLVVQALTR